MLIVRTLLQLLILLMHTVIVVLGCAVPVTLAIQTVYVDGTWTLDAWSTTLASGHMQRWVELLWHTGVIGIISVAIAITGGLFLALLGFKLRWFGRSVMAAVVVVGASVPLYVASAALIAAIDTLRPFGFDRISMTGSPCAAGILHGVVYMPLAAVLCGIGLLAVEPELEEAGVLRCSSWRVIVGITKTP